VQLLTLERAATATVEAFSGGTCLARVVRVLRLIVVVIGLAGLLGSSTVRAAPPPNRIAVELSPFSLDWYFGGEYLADDAISSTSVGISFERRAWRHLAAGAVVTYIQPGSVLLPPVPGIPFRRGHFDGGALRTSSRMVVAQARLRLIFPFADDRGEIGVVVAAGPAFLAYPGNYRGWGHAADLGVDTVWFWSEWGGALRASAGYGITRGHYDGNLPGAQFSAELDRAIALTLTLALVRRF
jgi:hypothetical protein